MRPFIGGDTPPNHPKNLKGARQWRDTCYALIGRALASLPNPPRIEKQSTTYLDLGRLAASIF